MPLRTPRSVVRRTSGTRTMPDVLRSWLGKGRSHEQDVAALEAGQPLAMVCVPVVDGVRRRRRSVLVSLTPRDDWFDVFGHPPYAVFDVRPPKGWVDSGGLLEVIGRSREGGWQVRVPATDVPLLRRALMRLTTADRHGPDTVG